MADLGAAAAYAEIEDVGIDAAEEIARLAGLSEIEYERQRPQSAKVLQMRAPVLDRLVQKERKAIDVDDDGKQGRRLDLPDTEPWHEPVRGEELIQDLCTQIKRYVVLGDHATLAVALWIIHAHALDAAEHSPRLHIASPEKRCGKSTLLGVIEPMLPRALSVENITSSALFRTIEAAQPTLLLDEADSFLVDNEEMRGLLNAGHARGGTVIKAVGEDFEPRQFTVWAATVIAGIGRIPTTIEDRSITIQLRRKLPGETVERLRSIRRGHIAEHGRKAARWAADHLDGLRDADPELPDSLSDRGQDNWRPLIGIADAIGHGWSERARQAAVALDGDGIGEEPTAGVMLLSDIMEIFEDRGTERLSGAEIVQALNEMEERPWPEWRRGKPVTQNSVSKLLKPFGIAPKKIRFHNDTARGYKRGVIQDAGQRYVPAAAHTPARNSGFQSGTTEHSREINHLGGNESGTRQHGVPVLNEPKRLKNNDCFGVPVWNGTDGQEWEL
jgi:putative DNA primase/helicase